MIFSLRDMIGGSDCQAGLPDGRWVRAVPMPFHGGICDRMRDAWAVLAGRVYAVRWPEPGELEAALGGRLGRGGDVHISGGTFRAGDGGARGRPGQPLVIKGGDWMGGK